MDKLKMQRTQDLPIPPTYFRVRACALIIRDGEVLLAEFLDENGLHYNLPAGGVDPGETVKEAVVREAWEEAGVRVAVGPLAFVHENAPHLSGFGQVPEISLMFACSVEGEAPSAPASPDPKQTGVRWVGLDELAGITLYPDIRKEIYEYAETGRTLDRLLEEHLL